MPAQATTAELCNGLKNKLQVYRSIIDRVQ